MILAGEFSPDARVVVTEEDIAEASTTGDVRIGEDQDLSTSADRESTEDSAEESEDHNLSSLIQSDTKIDPQILFNGKYVYKQSVVKQIFQQGVISGDRLRRVAGLTKYLSTTTVEDIDYVILVGDVVAVRTTSVIVATITGLYEGNSKRKSMNSEALLHAKVGCKQLETSIDGDKVIWTGNHIGGAFQIQGRMVAQIKADYCDVEKRYWFDRSFLMDVAVQVSTGADPRTGTDPNTFKCYLCSKLIRKEKMRHHVAWHILRQPPGSALGLPCGFCGRKETCNSTLQASSRKSKVKHLQTLTNCPYFVKFNRPKKSTAYAPSTNCVMLCLVCPQYHWKYNMAQHFSTNHGDHELPEDYALEKAEEERVKKLKF